MKIKADLKLNPRESRVWIEVDGKEYELPVQNITVFQASDNFLMAQISVKMDSIKVDTEFMNAIEFQDEKGKTIKLKQKDEKLKE